MSQILRWHVFETAGAVHAEAAATIARLARDRHGQPFSIVLTGGGTAAGVYPRLRELVTDWSAWRVYWGDERCVPPDHPERNSRLARLAWLDHVPLPPEQIHPIPAELGAGEGARRYDALVRGLPEFDLVLLGLGEDGHVASLFPGRDIGAAPGGPAALAVFDAPKPPPGRVSLSAWRLGLARHVLVVASGPGKRDAVNAWRAGRDLPVRAIRPRDGVDVLLDRACAAG